MKNIKNLKNSVVTVGIMGSCGGVGVTHLAIMLAGYLSSKEHRKTALIEFNHAGAFSALYDLYNDKNRGSEEVDNQFNLNGVDYYTMKTESQLAEVFQKGYEYIILDLGWDWDNNYAELLRCNIGCIAGSLSEWKIIEFEKSIFRLSRMEVIESFHFVAAFGMEKLKKNIEKKYHIKISMIPYEPSPFLLHKETFAFFDMLCR